MPNFSIKPTSSKISLSWESTYQLLQDVKHPHTRQRAFNLLLQAHADDIAAMCRSTSWARQWGFEDAYQEAVTHFFETALRTDDPADLQSYWYLRNAVRAGAARNLYPISVTPYFAQKLQSRSFSSELEIVSSPPSNPDSFDELGWHFLQTLCQRYLTKQQQSIFHLLCTNPGDIPTISELAEFLNLSKASAQRAWNYFQNVFKKNLEIIHHLYHSLGLDFLQLYCHIPLPLSVNTEFERQTPNSTARYTYSTWDQASTLSVVCRLMQQIVQPLAHPNTFITGHLTHKFSSIHAIFCRNLFSSLLLSSNNTDTLLFPSEHIRINFFYVHFRDLLIFHPTPDALSFHRLFPFSIVAPYRVYLSNLTYLLGVFFDYLSRTPQVFSNLLLRFLPWFIGSLRPVRGSPPL